MAKKLRKKIYVDKNVQGAIVRRILIYWISCLLFVVVPVLLARVAADPSRLFFEHFGDLWKQYWQVVPAAILILPLLLYDGLKLSNRFAGPVWRLRRVMSQMAAGEDVQEIHFRDGDYWLDLAESFNKIAIRLKAKESREPTEDQDQISDVVSQV